MPELLLPPRELISKPHPDDPIEYYYRPLTAPLYRTRLRDALAVLGPGPFPALLDVGYGSGVFLPELARRTGRLVGVDVHDGREGVARMAAAIGIEVDLRQASLFELPFADGEFAALVCMSVLEHLRDLDAALTELARVIAPGGRLVLGSPVRNVLTNSFFRLVGYDPLDIHPSSHRDVAAAVERNPLLAERARRVFPRWLPLDVAAYLTLGCERV
jgi:2-polyprenyl-3-methyl-5-hydroxy-6-metoxy-1,4-benzoquinol methylase